jgi:tricarballylate dehydrogenase
MVNAEGKRFVDEGSDFRNYTYAKIGRIVLQQPGGYAWQIFDLTAKPFHREMYQSRNATRVPANTLEELADKLDDVDRTQFLKTVREYNDAIKRDVSFDPTILDGKCTVGLPIPKSNWANPIEKPPFEAYSVGCGITFTFGGVKINTSAQVLDVSDTPLPGVYAAGELVGGIWYFNYPGSGGLTAGAVFGRIAGGEAGRYAQS